MSAPVVENVSEEDLGFRHSRTSSIELNLNVTEQEFRNKVAEKLPLFRKWGAELLVKRKENAALKDEVKSLQEQLAAAQANQANGAAPVVSAPADDSEKKELREKNAELSEEVEDLRGQLAKFAVLAKDNAKLKQKLKALSEYVLQAAQTLTQAVETTQKH